MNRPLAEFSPLLKGALLTMVLSATPVIAQDTLPPTPAAATQDPLRALPRAKRGAEFVIPAVSVILPGFGQYVQRAPVAGAAFTATAVSGIVLSSVGDGWGDDWAGDFPRSGRDQLAAVGTDVMTTASLLSAWDSFHRSVPALQARGKYEFLSSRESVGDLLSAPVDPRFLRRWTTWVDLAQTVAVTTLILSDRGPRSRHTPFHANDAAWATATSLNAAVGEEALFRGWLLPALHQNTGGRFWLANGTQAALFGAAHAPDAEWFAVYIGAWAAWEGWVTRRNEWSIRESIFHHFWYDVGVFTAAMLTEDRNRELRLSFPGISF